MRDMIGFLLILGICVAIVGAFSFWGPKYEPPVLSSSFVGEVIDKKFTPEGQGNAWSGPREAKLVFTLERGDKAVTFLETDGDRAVVYNSMFNKGGLVKVKWVPFGSNPSPSMVTLDTSFWKERSYSVSVVRKKSKEAAHGTPGHVQASD